jgi:hypothetical protein
MVRPAGGGKQISGASVSWMDHEPSWLAVRRLHEAAASVPFDSDIMHARHRIGLIALSVVSIPAYALALGPLNRCFNRDPSGPPAWLETAEIPILLILPKPLMWRYCDYLNWWDGGMR